MRFLTLLLAPLVCAQTINWAGCGPTYGPKIGAECAFTVSLGQGVNSFTLMEFGSAPTIGTGIEKDIFQHAIGKNWNFHLPILTTVGTSAGSSATTASFAGGFYPTFIFRKRWAFSFGFITQTGAAKGNLYGASPGFVP